MGEITTASELLSKIKTKEEPYEIPELGITITLKLFNKGIQQEARKEALAQGEWDNHEFEKIIFKRGISKPEMSDDQLDELYDAIGIDHFNGIVQKIVTKSQPSQEESAKAEANFLPEREPQE